MLLTALLGCAHEGERPSAPVVRELALEGADQVSERALERGIATSATSVWPFAKKQYFDPFTWQSDLRRIERMYRARGFYQAEVTGDEVRQVDDGVELTAHLREGKPTRVASVRYQGLDGLPSEERAKVLADLDLEGVFQEGHWRNAKETVRARLRELGYARARVTGRALVDVDTQTAALLIAADTGPLCSFGDILIESGPRPRIVPLWIWEQVRIAIPDGKLFSEAALVEAQRRVFAMGVFSVAKVTAGEPDPTSHRMPVLVEVREAPLRMLRTGVGIKVDQVRNEARASLEWSHLDFMGGMRKLTARGEAGWAFIPNAYAVARNDVAAGARNGPLVRSRLELEQPRLAGEPRLRGQATLELQRTLEQAYDSLGGKASLGASWHPWSTLSVYARYNVQGDYVNGPAIASISAAPLTLGCVSESASCLLWLSYLEQIVTWDKRDSSLEPRRGFFASLGVQEGGGPLLGNFTYLRLVGELRGYLTLGNLVTLSGRARMGEIFHRGGETAVVTRFFPGGGVSMRGFSDRRLSPLLLAPPPSTQLGAPPLLTLPIGGNGMYEGSLELRWNLTESLGLAVFVDVGQVSRGSLSASDFAAALWAVGFGFRYRTAIGPIRIDLARRLAVGRPPPLFAIDGATGAISQLPYAVNDDCFGLGGSGRSTPVSDGACVFHIAIGEAF